MQNAEKIMEPVLVTALKDMKEIHLTKTEVVEENVNQITIAL
jgi:hypothetical protein